MLAATHYWTDYASAFGAIVGILIAAAAFAVAQRSAKDATRSADSAERTARAAEAISTASNATLHSATEQLDLARREHERLEAERARRPAVERIELSDIHPRPGELSPGGVFRVGFLNSGDRDLQGAILTILFDPGCAATLCDRWGNLAREESRDETHEAWPGVDGTLRAFDYLARRVSVEAGVASVTYVRVPRIGRFPIRAKLFHAVLVGGGPWIDAWIDVNEHETTVVRLADGGAAGRYQGRSADFDAQLP